MTVKYLLPCDCGERVVIELGQAGQRVACVCGKELTVPTMRGIKVLETAPDEAPVPSRDGNWNATRGAVFAIGLTLSVIAFGIAGYYVFQRSRLETQEYEWDRPDLANQQIDDMNDLQTYYLWMNYYTGGLGEQFPPDFVRAKKQAAEFLAIAGVAGVCGSLGLALAAAAVFAPGRRDQV